MVDQLQSFIHRKVQFCPVQSAECHTRDLDSDNYTSESALFHHRLHSHQNPKQTPQSPEPPNRPHSHQNPKQCRLSYGDAECRKAEGWRLWIRTCKIRRFLGLPNPLLFVRIRIHPSKSKKSKDNLVFYYFVTPF